MWALHITNGWTVNELNALLNDKDEYVRAWAIQLLCEDFNPPAEAVSTFTQMAKSDASPVVRLYLAAALQRIDEDSRWPVAAELVKHAQDSADHNIPKMIWLGIEPLVKKIPPAPCRSRAMAVSPCWWNLPPAAPWMPMPPK